MPMNVAGTVFPVVMWLIVIAWIIFALILTMHFLMPKDVLIKYFKPPHFKTGECQLFSGIPYAPMRTIIFMTVFAFPKKGAKRKLTKAHMLVPGWYKIASKLILIALVLTIAGILILSFGAYIYDEFIATGRSVL